MALYTHWGLASMVAFTDTVTDDPASGHTAVLAADPLTR